MNDNLCEGRYWLIDICNDDNEGNPIKVEVVNYVDGPNSSCNGLPTVE